MIVTNVHLQLLGLCKLFSCSRRVHDALAFISAVASVCRLLSRSGDNWALAFLFFGVSVRESSPTAKADAYVGLLAFYKVLQLIPQLRFLIRELVTRGSLYDPWTELLQVCALVHRFRPSSQSITPRR